MSSPIAFSNASSSNSSSSSGSPTGVYMPLHKRKAIGASNASTTRARNTAAPAGNAQASRSARKQVPFVYDITQLRALASSPLVGVSSSQESQLAELAACISARAPGARGAPEKAPRRRRAGRRASNAKKLQAEVHVGVESRRRRHGAGAWGWQAHAGVEESWRHAPLEVRV